MPTDTSLYGVLGVSPDADARAIKAAFHLAVKACHPDVDSSPAAHDRTLRILRAYRTLGDPQRRRTYDARLRQRTGATRPTTHRPIALAANNGHREPRHHELADLPTPPGSIGSPTPRRTLRAAGWFAAFIVVGLIMSMLGGLVISHHTGSASVDSSVVRTPLGRVDTVSSAIAGPRERSSHGSWSRIAPILIRCLEPTSGLSGDTLYRQCVTARVGLHLLMDNAPARLREQIDLDDALAERRQAIGAQQQHLASTQTFTDESVATFISIRDTTTDEHLRAIAQTYVDCATPKRCTIDTSNDRREIDDAILKI